jgi:hypothetical protein
LRRYCTCGPCCCRTDIVACHQRRVASALIQQTNPYEGSSEWSLFVRADIAARAGFERGGRVADDRVARRQTCRHFDPGRAGGPRHGSGRANRRPRPAPCARPGRPGLFPVAPARALNRRARRSGRTAARAECPARRWARQCRGRSPAAGFARAAVRPAGRRRFCRQNPPQAGRSSGSGGRWRCRGGVRLRSSIGDAETRNRTVS